MSNTEMQSRMERFVLNELTVDLKNSKILLAISGGVDSMVMFNLFLALKPHIGILHCNFNLRDDESDNDEAFVKEIARGHNLKCYTKRFDTLEYAKREKYSTQMAARALRYKWFEEVRAKENYDYVAVAHHQNDEVETFFINILRGTGLAGLTGIQIQNKHVIRPMMCFNRNEIELYAQNHRISFQEDSSNASTKYVRNALRNKVLPILRELQPGLDKTILREISQFRDIQKVYNESINDKMDQIIIKYDDTERIELPKKKLNEISTLKPYLFEFLKNFGFNSSDAQDISEGYMLSDQAEYFSATHRLIREKNNLVLLPLRTQESSKEFLIDRAQSSFYLDDIELHLDYVNEGMAHINFEEGKAYFDLSRLKFPLKMRRWKEGDVFYPLGMKGKKKLSDFFIDEKYTLTEKENTWLLLSGTDIIGVIGARMDDRYKIRHHTNQILILTVIKRK